MQWRRLDPRHSFFGRIFFWFWFITLVSLGAGVLTARYFVATPEYATPTQQQINTLNAVAQRLSELPISNRTDLERALRRVGRRFETAVFVVDAQSEQFEFGFPPPPRRAMQPYIDLARGQQVLVLTRANTQFIGPQTIQLGQRNLAVFVGTMRINEDARMPMALSILAVAFVVSGALCFWLARSFSRPVQEIQRATEGLASGNLNTRVSLTQPRQDELGKLAHATNQMAAQLQQLFTEHQRFLADISHELRSPLTRLQIAIGVAEQQPEVSAEVLQRISKESEQMEHMIAQLLWLSRLTSNSVELKFQQYSIATIIESLLYPLLQDLRFEADAHGKSITFSDTEVMLQASASICPELLVSALENVCRNAIRYAESTVDVGIKTVSSKLLISVSDDGPGVNVEELNALFKPFYRTDPSRNRDSGGAGLGLSIAQRAIERHGGNIQAQLRQDRQGLMVCIEIPLTNTVHDVENS